ncbi:hypothetical protein BJY52DRAFT_1195868 [Lactarius psammicola]|nr:hypothetical protein BJY52DRAFT_1195868 [Lactarius psammicola]
MSKKTLPNRNRLGKFTAKSNPPSSLATPAPTTRKASQNLASSSVLPITEEPSSPHVSITSELPGSFPSSAAPSPARIRSPSLASAQLVNQPTPLHSRSAPPPSVANPALSAKPIAPLANLVLPVNPIAPLANPVLPVNPIALLANNTADPADHTTDPADHTADPADHPADLVNPLANPDNTTADHADLSTDPADPSTNPANPPTDLVNPTNPPDNLIDPLADLVNPLANFTYLPINPVLLRIRQNNILPLPFYQPPPAPTLSQCPCSASLSRLHTSAPPQPPTALPAPPMPPHTVIGPAAMPRPTKTPFFAGMSNEPIADFLSDYGELADGHKLSNKQKVEMIL